MRIEGLYAITDPGLIADHELLDKVTAAIVGGARLIQYRHKHLAPAAALSQATRLAALCRQHSTLFIVNDDPVLAAQCDAHGVHIGRDDPDIQQARAIVGSQRLVGVSCYNELQRAQTAQAGGADYVAFGSFYASAVKPDAVTAGIELLRQARATLSVPIVAIGGINTDNGAALIDAGADALAVISAVFAANDVTAAAGSLAALFEQSDH